MSKNTEKELKVMEFVNENSTVEENKEEVEMVEEKKGIIAKFKGLKTWQKVGIIAAGVAGLGLGGTAVVKLLSNNREAAADLVEAAEEVAAEEESFEVPAAAVIANADQMEA